MIGHELLKPFRLPARCRSTHAVEYLPELRLAVPLRCQRDPGQSLYRYQGFVCLHRGYSLDFDQSTSRARTMAGEVGFFALTQCGERPARYARCRCFETSPSSPMLQAARNRSGPNLAELERRDEDTIAAPSKKPC
jgi:hypothetical protein